MWVWSLHRKVENHYLQIFYILTVFLNILRGVEYLCILVCFVN
uniref:Uncharacterized protein n=1 Tax=Anguilla anguilla TaxID=7936 RepID=A0A0E9TAI3_ANGAN